MSSLSVLKREECRSLFPGLDELPHQQTIFHINRDYHVEKFRAVIRGNSRLIVREVADEVGISIGACHQILTEKLKMRSVSAKFLLRFLNNDPKEKRADTNRTRMTNNYYVYTVSRYS